jgi:AAA family ATP:ADP antiporter
MSRGSTPTDSLALVAVVSAATMIAFQVGGKAARDALFLSNFPVTALPGMLVAAAAFSILAVLATSRVMSARGPAAIVPAAFGASAILLLAQWAVSTVMPKVAAITFYLHMAAFGAILISGFWSIVGELFDPRTAKSKVGRIAAGGTLGGLLGGVLAERTGAVLSVNSMLLALSVLHFACAFLNHQLRVPKATVHRDVHSASQMPQARSGVGVIFEVPYLRNLAGLVLLGTIAETMLDYVFKAQATAAFGRGGQLLRFFAIFYTVASLVTFLMQSALSKYFLQRFGLTRTLSTMPVLVAAGGLGSLIWPGLFSTIMVRGGQSVLRSSLFRSGYELLYTPVIKEEKRAAKPIVDVGFDRLGDAVGGGLIRVVLSLGLAASLGNQLLLGIAVVLGALCVVLTTRLGKGYVSTLENSLMNQAAELDLIDTEERTTRATMLRTLGTVDMIAIRSLQTVTSRRPQPQQARAQQPAPQAAGIDSVVRRLVDLRAESPAVVRAALTSRESLDPLVVAAVIRLLARDDVAEDAVKALRKVAATAVGQLTDALLNAEEDFAVRRRIPRVLASYSSERTVEGLVRGLTDHRFEVRFNCGRALSRICSRDPQMAPASDIIYTATLREIEVARRIVDPPRIIDQDDDQTDPPALDAHVLKSANLRLEHVFRLLSLCLPREPLHISFQALHTDDAYLKGTALEYLESVLPSPVRENLLQFLEGPARPAVARRSSDVVLEELMRSSPRIGRSGGTV